jgi:MFS family permease
MRGGNGVEALEGSGFRLLWAGRATSELGSALVPVALAFAVIDLTDSAAALGLVLTTGFVSRIGFLLLGGVVADRLPRQRVMLAADALRALTQALVAALLLAEQAQVWHLLVLFAVYGAADAFFAPAATAIVPEVVGSADLQRANALLALTRSASTVVGPALAGLLVAAAGTGVVFALDALTFAVSSVTLALLRLPVGAATTPAGVGVLGDLRAGWDEVARRTWVWTSIVYFAVSNLAIAPLFVLGPFVSDESLGGAAGWGLITTCAGLGAVLGDAAVLRLRPWRPLTAGYLVLATLALEPALLAVPASTPAIAASAALGFGALSFSNALWLTALQERIPRGSLSRVSSYDWLGSRALQPAGYALAGPLAAAVGIPATLVAGAALHAAASVAIALSPSVRRLQRPGEERGADPSLARG